MSEPGWASGWKENLGILLGVTSAVFVVIRTLSLAHFDPETAYGILQAGGAGAVIIGALLSSIGPLAIAASGLCILAATLSANKQDTRRGLEIFGSIVFGLISIFTAPFLLLCICIVLLAGYIIQGKTVINRIRRRMKEAEDEGSPDADARALSYVEEELRRQRGRKRNAFFRTMVLSAITLGLVSLAGPSWYPTERIDIKGRAPEAVYVLSDSNNEIAALNIYTRQLEYFDEGLVTNRQLCESPQGSVADKLFDFEPLPTFFRSQSNYVPCPED
jgi:hypothetical protein